MKRLFPLVLACAFASVPAMSADMMTSASKAATGDKAKILALEKKYNEGFNSKNVDMIMSCYAPGDQLFVFDVVPPREYSSWDAYKKDWQALFTAYPGPVTNAISEQTVNVAGPLAYGHSIETGTFTRKDGSKLATTIRTTDIYRKIGGKWLIVEEHNSMPVDLDTMKADPLSKV
jgi:ketosteroid isomerase-like protein